jgi:hypothetical protein
MPEICCYNFCIGPVAQSVEQRIENPCVGGSIPPQATSVNAPQRPLGFWGVSTSERIFLQKLEFPNSYWWKTQGRLKMAIVKKITIGIAPFAKMFRIPAMGGAAVDALLALRSKSLSDDFFDEVGVDSDRRWFRVSKAGGANSLMIHEDSVAFTKDYYGPGGTFDFDKVFTEFKLVWSAVNKVLGVRDIRRIGIACEYRYQVPGGNPSSWIRTNFTKFASPQSRATEKMNIRFEERELTTDGKAPDPLKANFTNYIYQYYDSSMDADHPQDGAVNGLLDVQRYFTPVLNGDVTDEILKLRRSFVAAEKAFDGQLKSLGASNGTK